MSKFIFYFFVLLSFFSCDSRKSSQQQQQEQFYARRYPAAKDSIISDNCRTITPCSDSIKTISVEIETNSHKPLYFFKVIDDVRFVALQTNPNCFVGQINELLLAPNRIICVSNIVDQVVTIFNDKGNFINKIENIGKGPNEYLSISRVQIDYCNSNIVLFDYNAKKLLRYDFDGNHISTREVFFYFSDYVFSKKSSHVFFSTDIESNMHIEPISSKRIICAREERKLVYASIDLPDEFVFVHYGIRNFYHNDETILYIPNFSDTIYAIDSTKIMARYNIKHRGRNLEFKDCNLKYFNNFDYNFLKDDVFHLVGPVLETKNYLYLEFRQGTKSFYSIYDKILKLTETGFIIARDLKIAPVYGYPIGVYDGNFVATINAVEIIEAFKNKLITDEYLNAHKDLKEIVMHLNENDNPIILFYKPL